MTYDIFIGDRMFSSWSLRGWLMLARFGLPHRTHLLGLYSGTLAQDLAPLAPARFVPVLRTPDGTIIGETLAMAETLAEAHPEARLWPADPILRARARWLCAEMTSGFSALRGACPMQLAQIWENFPVTPDVAGDLDRIETLWSGAWALAGSDDGWLLGTYSLADVFFSPVAARVVGYDLPVGPKARAYCARAITDDAFCAWRAEALKTRYEPFPYPMSLPHRAWPDPGAR